MAVIEEAEKIGIKLTHISSATGISRSKLYNVKRGTSKLTMAEIAAIRRYINKYKDLTSGVDSTSIANDPGAEYQTKKDLYNLDKLIDTVWELRQRIKQLEDEKE